MRPDHGLPSRSSTAHFTFTAIAGFDIRRGRLDVTCGSAAGPQITQGSWPEPH
jgi:hypothetical protein